MSSPWRRISIFLFIIVFFNNNKDSFAAPPSPEKVTFREAKRKWKQTKISSYMITYQRDCFCPWDIVQPMDITVNNNIITNVVYSDPNYIPCNNDPWFVGEQCYPPSKLDDFYWVETIDDIFDRIEIALDNGYFEVNVIYDDVTGIPLFTYIDECQLIIDEEYQSSITFFDG